MEQKDIVRLAEEYCRHYHSGKKRKGGNQEPYSDHPFAVRDILVRYGYDDHEIQAMALLHDTIEDTEIGRNKKEIEGRFGKLIYEGVYELSNNTIGKHARKLAPLLNQFGIALIDNNGKLTPEAYKIRIFFSRDSVKRVKIADMIHNTASMSALNKPGIEKKIDDAERFYIPLGRAVAPIMVNELEANIVNYKGSEHYQKTFCRV
jgi:(p)ppGpp synthase/HD superfamily hydrolase